MDTFHVNASLPRSGSELLQCLLSQHPGVYGGAQSPLAEFAAGSYQGIQGPQALSHGVDRIQTAHANMTRAGFKGFYETLTPKPVVVDKSRSWLAYMELVWKSFPNAKMLCMFRDYAEIMESLDKKFRANPAHPDFNGAPVLKELRFRDYWPKRPPLAWSIPAYEERRSRPDDRVLYISYNRLVSSPESTIETMRYVFQFLGVQPIDVDPNNVVKEAYEIDGLYGPLGDHNIRSVVRPRQPGE